jgi:hypothetical protein
MMFRFACLFYVDLPVETKKTIYFIAGIVTKQLCNKPVSEQLQVNHSRKQLGIAKAIKILSFIPYPTNIPEFGYF